MNIRVLYVDDQKTFNLTLYNYLCSYFSSVSNCCSDINEVLLQLETNSYDLIIIDFDIPDINGLELSQIIKANNPHQNIVMVSTYTEKEAFIQSMHLGVDGYISKPFVKEQAQLVFSKLCEKINHTKENERYKSYLQSEVNRQLAEILELEKEQEKSYKEFLFGLVNLVEERDTYTGGHSMRVAYYAKGIAQLMGLDDDLCNKVYQAGMLHDIGKTVIPDSILLKPERLSNVEYRLIQQHVSMSKSILDKIPMFRELVPIIESHHERIDGSGYPLGLKNDQIPIESQLIAISDCFDAMTTRRIYKRTMTKEDALLEINGLKDIHFKKEIVDIALKYFKTISLNQIADQRPKSLLEYERFSFFFKDQLTKLFNQNYLDYMFLNDECSYEYCSCLCIEKFYKYNDAHGWEEGNILLNDIAECLKKRTPEALLFRIKGDMFLILAHENIDLDCNALSLIPSKSNVKFSFPLHNESFTTLVQYLSL
nr:HD domain-containing phosphohydrolase [Sulfurospirillum sp. 'SP']